MNADNLRCRLFAIASRSPVDDDMQIDPAESRNHHLGHIDPPIPVRLNRPRLVRNGLARRFEVTVFRNEQIELSHKTVYPFPVDRTLFMVLEIRPNTTIPPIWVLRPSTFEYLRPTPHWLPNLPGGALPFVFF